VHFLLRTIWLDDGRLCQTATFVHGRIHNDPVWHVPIEEVKSLNISFKSGFGFEFEFGIPNWIPQENVPFRCDAFPFSGFGKVIPSN
jgi:hypothetical protein